MWTTHVPRVGRVEHRRPEQVALDRGEGRTGEPDRVSGGREVTAYQRKVAGHDGGVGARTHGDAEVGGQRGG